MEQHLAQEGLLFCLYCGGELAPAPPEVAKHGCCVRCGTGWERVCSNECPGCTSGWVHLHHPDESQWLPDGSPVEATGYGWCDACGTHVSYRWWRPTDDAREEYGISFAFVLQAMSGTAADSGDPHRWGDAREMVVAS